MPIDLSGNNEHNLTANYYEDRQYQSAADGRSQEPNPSFRGDRNPVFHNISLSNPNSVRTSPVNLSMSSMFSPPTSRRGVPLPGMAQASARHHRSFPNSPMPEVSFSTPYPLPSTSAYNTATASQRYGSTQLNPSMSYANQSSGSYPIQQTSGSYPNQVSGSYPTQGYWGQPQEQQQALYSGAGPSSLPSSNYLLTHRAGSLGPSPGTGGSPYMGRRSPRDQQQQYNTGRSTGRPSLMRQHRSLESEFPPADPYFHPVGSGIGIEIPHSVSNNYHLSPGGQTYGGGLSYSGGTSIPTTLPLSVTTGTGSYAMGAGPLSNPGASFGGGGGYGSQGAPYAPPVVVPTHFARDPYSMPVPVLQREYDMLRREYEASIQKLNSTMNSIKTFWSPELKKERSLRKEESSKFSLTQEQMKMASQENQKQAAVIRQLQDELQCQYELHRTIRDTDVQYVPKDEYEALRLERDRLHRELQLARDTVRELELQIETQRQTLVSRDESIKRLLDMLQNKGIIPYNAAQERMELEHARARAMEMETRARHLESTLHQKDVDIRSLQEECMNASDKLRQLQLQFEQYQRVPHHGGESSAFQSLLDTKESRIEQLERQVSMYLDEMNKMRQDRLSGSVPRDFTDKSISDHDYQEMKLKMEKSEMELSHKQSEILTIQTRIAASEEQLQDLKKHLEVVKEANSAKEQQIGLLQSDIEALRTKLENKNETIDQKQTQISQLQQEKNRLQSENADREEQLKIRDGKGSMQQRKIEGLEELVKEKEHQLVLLKERLQNSPAMQQQRAIQDQLDEVMRERDRDRREMREQCERLENQRIEQLEAHRREVRDLRMAIESLQKEISDRQVLIESQNEKISDLNRELISLRHATHSSLSERAEGPERFELSRLNMDLDQARGEVDRLLKIVQVLDKDKEGLGHKIKDMQKQLDDERRMKGTDPLSGSTDYGLDPYSVRKTGSGTNLQRDQRVEELEEALRESVSITAERELAIAQQKQISQQMEQRMTQYKEQLQQVQRQYDEMNGKVTVLSQDKQDKDSLIKSLKHERRKHLEDVLALKQEALLAAISEKDAHIALVEGSQKHSPEELHTLKKHKEKLMRKLKEENEKRIRLLNEQKDQDFNFLASGSISKDLKATTAEQLEQAVRNVELQKKKMRVFIDQLVACILEISPDLLNGLPRTQQSQGIDMNLLKKLPYHQLVMELQQRETDSLQLQRYANHLLQRLAQVQPEMVRRALRLLDSLETPASVFNYVSAGREGIAGLASSALAYLPPLSPPLSMKQQRIWKRHRSVEDPPSPLLSLLPSAKPKHYRKLIRHASEGSDAQMRKQPHPSYKHVTTPPPPRRKADNMQRDNEYRRSRSRTPIADRLEPEEMEQTDYERRDYYDQRDPPRPAPRKVSEYEDRSYAKRSREEDPGSWRRDEQPRREQRTRPVEAEKPTPRTQTSSGPPRPIEDARPERKRSDYSRSRVLEKSLESLPERKISHEDSFPQRKVSEGANRKISRESRRESEGPRVYETRQSSGESEGRRRAREERNEQNSSYQR